MGAERVSDGGGSLAVVAAGVAGWLVGWSVLVCAFVCAFVSAFMCSFRGLFARVSCPGLRFYEVTLGRFSTYALACEIQPIEIHGSRGERAMKT